jgi:hypothetical protein
VVFILIHSLIRFQNRRAKRKQEKTQAANSKKINTSLLPQQQQGLSTQQQRNSTNSASLKLPPLRNLTEECDKLRTKGIQLSVDVTLPPLHLVIPQVLFYSHNTSKYHNSNCCKSSTQSIHSDNHQNKFSQCPLVLPHVCHVQSQQKGKPYSCAASNTANYLYSYIIFPVYSYPDATSSLPSKGNFGEKGRMSIYKLLT